MNTHPLPLPARECLASPKGEIGLPQLRMVRNCLLVELPGYVDELSRTQESRFVTATLDGVKYAPTHGRVIKTGSRQSTYAEASVDGLAVGNDEDNPEAFVKFAQVGDEVFFAKNLWENAKEAAFDSEDERFTGLYAGHRVFAVALPPSPLKGEFGLPAEKPKYYMIIPEDMVLVVKRKKVGSRQWAVGNENTESEVLPVNGYVLCAPVDRGQGTVDGGLLINDLREEDYTVNLARVIKTGTRDKGQGEEVGSRQWAVGNEENANAWLEVGDMVQTLRHCDILLEEELNCPVEMDDRRQTTDDRKTKASNYFIIEGTDIISKYTDMQTKYKAGVKRVVIKPEAVSDETAGGLINTELQLQKLLTGVVVSTGDGAISCQPGDRVVYARNSGNVLPLLPGNEEPLLCINDVDVFAVVVEELTADHGPLTTDR